MNRPTIENDSIPWKHILGVFVFQIVALTLAARIFRYALNPDAVAYLQIASYYAQGHTNLAISGYWSPLISWIIAPMLKLGVPSLVAARIFMELSAVIFLVGCLRIFLKFKMPRQSLCLGLWVSALLSIPWSVENITPDLLLSGLVSFAFAPMVTPRWFLKPHCTLFCGLVWGVAYLCKSIALPLGVLTSFGIAAWWWKNRETRFEVARGLLLTLLGIALISVLWIGILSKHYGKFTLANSARLNHSLAGSTVVEHLYVLDQGFHQLQPGRITIWEDPPLPYPDWSPWASWSNALLQLRIVIYNIPVALIMLTGIALTFPFLAAVTAVRFLKLRNYSENKSFTWLALLPVFVLGTLFLPNYLLISEQRYFYCTLPLLFVATAGMISENQAFSRSWIQRYSTAVLAICFLIPTLGRSALHLNSTRIAGGDAHVLAQKISEARLAGSLAGSGRLPGGRAGLYVAYLLHQPWLGDKPSPSVADFKSSGASLIIVNRGTDIARALAADQDFRNLDADLFGSGDEAGQFPIQIFKTLHPAVSTSP